MRELQTLSFEFISDLQLDAEGLTRLLLDSANSLLEWDVLWELSQNFIITFD